MRSPRGTTLIEMMVVVAILAILAALAAPQLLLTVKKARLAGEAEAVAGFLEGVRQRAIADGRCYRVTRTSATVLTVEQRDSGDCVNLNKDSWIVKQTLRGEPGSTYTISNTDIIGSGGTQTVAGNATGPPNEIIFRPNGKLRGRDDNITTNDKARIVVGQGTLTETRSVVTMESGRICVIAHVGAAPAFAGSNAGNDCNVFIP